MTNQTRAALLPTKKMAEHWVEMLTSKRNEKNDEKRESQFQFTHGWLRALVDAEMLSNAYFTELRGLLIAVKPDG